MTRARAAFCCEALRRGAKRWVVPDACGRAGNLLPRADGGEWARRRARCSRWQGATAEGTKHCRGHKSLCPRQISKGDVDFVANLGIFVLFAAVGGDAAAGFEDQALGCLFDKADEHGTVECAAVAPACDAGVPPAIVTFGLGDETTSGAFRRSRHTAGRSRRKRISPKWADSRRGVVRRSHCWFVRAAHGG